MIYRDKVVIITGGSHGIGEGCVRVFAAAGANVVFCARNERESAAFVDKLKALKAGKIQFITKAKEEKTPVLSEPPKVEENA